MSVADCASRCLPTCTPSGPPKSTQRPLSPKARQTSPDPVAWRKATAQRRHAKETSPNHRAAHEKYRDRRHGGRASTAPEPEAPIPACHAACRCGPSRSNPHAARNRDHGRSAFNVAAINAVGAPGPIRTRASFTSTTMTSGTPAAGCAAGDASITTDANPTRSPSPTFATRAAICRQGSCKHPPEEYRSARRSATSSTSPSLRAALRSTAPRPPPFCAPPSSR